MNADKRDALGRLVRKVWIAWAMEHREPKASWLVEWDRLGASDREVDMRIGEAVYDEGHNEALDELRKWQPLIEAVRVMRDAADAIPTHSEDSDEDEKLAAWDAATYAAVDVLRTIEGGQP